MNSASAWRTAYLASASLIALVATSAAVSAQTFPDTHGGSGGSLDLTRFSGLVGGNGGDGVAVVDGGVGALLIGSGITLTESRHIRRRSVSR